jgi:hypothetical protein
VAERLALAQLGALDVERAFVTADGTRPPTPGTGLVLAQRLGLLFQERLQGAFGETGGGGLGDLLHGIEIDVESGSLVAEGTAGNNSAPLRGEVAELLKFLGGKGAACHAASCVGVEASAKLKVAPVRLWRST